VGRDQEKQDLMEPIAETGTRGKQAKLSLARFVAYATLVCCIAAKNPTGKMNDYYGSRFWCGERLRTKVCLSVLTAGCSLEFVPGAGVPSEPNDELWVKSSSGRKIVRGPADLERCVTITSPEKALEYLRFFSSYETVHLFSGNRMEIFSVERGSDCKLACLPQNDWRRHRLKNAISSRVAGGFLIERTVVGFIDEPWKVQAYFRRELVEKSGRVVLLEERPLNLSFRELGTICFPMFA
jgi:hypothetical protein